MAVEMSIQEYIRQRSDRDGFETAMFIYQSALTQMGSRIEVLNSELNHMHSYNPIEYVKSRLKTPESIMKKLRKERAKNRRKRKTVIQRRWKRKAFPMQSANIMG